MTDDYFPGDPLPEELTARLNQIGADVADLKNADAARSINAEMRALNLTKGMWKHAGAIAWEAMKEERRRLRLERAESKSAEFLAIEQALFAEGLRGEEYRSAVKRAWQERCAEKSP